MMTDLTQPQPEKDEPQQFDYNKLKPIIEFCRKDFFIIALCLLVIGICIATAANISNMSGACNDFYQEQMERCQCGIYSLKNFTPSYKFTLTGGEINVSQD